MKKFRLTAAIILTVAIIPFLVFSPKYILANVNRNIYKEWREIENPPYSGVISVWHVVDFKPPTGSITELLDSIATKVEKSNIGIYFDVRGMDRSEYGERIAAGGSPDILSFPLGLTYADELLEIDDASIFDNIKEPLRHVGENGNAVAIAYTYSRYQIILNDEALSKENIYASDTNFFDNDINAALPVEFSGNSIVATLLGVSKEIMPRESFLSGESTVLIDDARGARELVTSYESGKGFLTSSHDITTFTDLVQLIAMHASIDESKLPFAREFISLLLSEKAQKQLGSMGLMCATIGCDSDTGDERIVNSPAIPNAFAYKREYDSLLQSAQNAWHDESAKKDFFSRIKELFDENEAALSSLIKYST